jgi:hypothetical protein
MLLTDEAFEKLTGRRAWYRNSGIKASTARVYKKRFLENKLDLESRIKLLEACGFRIVRQMRWEDHSTFERIKRDLIRKLRRENAFWYGNPSNNKISDEELIEKVLMYLDIGDIDTLFKVFSKREIRDVWKELIIPQGTAWHKLNILYAILYFDIADPERYLRDSLRNRPVPAR